MPNATFPAHSLVFARDPGDALALHVIDAGGLEGWLKTRPEGLRNWVRATGFAAAQGKVLMVPGADGTPEMALVGYGTAETRARGRFHLAAAAAALPEGVYRLEGLDPARAQEEALGWLLAAYVFDRYHIQKGPTARLVAPDGVDAARLEVIAAGEALTRDLINTPANDMGPDTLEAACTDLAVQHGADITVTAGADLLAQNLPLIHAVGRASDCAPRLIDMSWGADGPALTLVGKGVCFDTGGLNLKPGSSMGLMKKDMGGAATVLGLAHMIMALDLPVRLRVLIPAVENSVSANAMRPGDILTARSGKTIEINNTDAEGRLVLADALTLGAEGAPDLMISMATLTGAARVAVGPDLAPYYTDDADLVTAIEAGAVAASDPVWRMPFHTPYETMIEPGIADLDNAPSGGFAGSITAALFLRRFAGAARYAHFDIYGWNPTAAPARPKGGVGMGARALLAALPAALNL
ncbi:M17 family metallopeptidase [Roseovarius sp. M141]|uniref:leucyl aminopeptidase family protein n=1 Tax=Roseovarius sp. M141 TaxID=2583806 RepID=UPI0020CFCA1F|nr:leucyl aminopeptidase family protein [Roseovarius sp. M141]MCQ0092175.1 leucyl aminopeptidase family protein [Roseovarius sp. M141]